MIRSSAEVFNTGSTGAGVIELYLDGKLCQEKLFPVIKNNSRTIDFEIRIYEAGDHMLAIGSSPYQTFAVEGAQPAVVYEDFELSNTRFLNGKKVVATAIARNLTSVTQKVTAALMLDHSMAVTRSIELKENESQRISFENEPPPGNHSVRIENSTSKNLTVSERVELDLSKMLLHQYCSAKAKPYSIESDAKANRFRITAGGSDFFHAEDSYAAVYLKGIKGDFVATVKINRFGDRTHEWFRSGLFLRNDISQSFDVQPGSKGSMLVFGTPGRGGIEYDEFANGCMHKASSTNLP